MRPAIVRAVVLAALAVLQCAGTAGARERDEVSAAEAENIDGVLLGFRHRDCKLAVSHLNKGLKEAYPSALVLAGSMYEDGLCLKAAWDQAERMYLRAHEAGHRAGLLRLVAGLARGQRDIGAALWWAQQVQISLPADCLVPAEARTTPEAFVQALQTWPAGRAQACAYVAGVMAFLVGDAEYPRSAAAMGLHGRVHLEYRPSEERMSWRTEELNEQALYGVSSGDAVADRSSRKYRSQLEVSMRELGERALQRYQRPAGVEPGWTIKARFLFDLR